MDYKEGEVLYFDKPLYWTSFNLVGRVRWALCKYLGIKKLKVGHAGTLDPMATGVMILCTGKATKMIPELQQQNKEYEATLFLGATTPSFDTEHEPDAFFPTDHITEESVRKVLKDFTGTIMQVPPAFSAVKVDGRRAYDYARKGSEVEIEAKAVEIFEIELKEFALPFMTIRVECGKGTYIRSLARDIGRALGSGAYLTALRRTRVGGVRVEDCKSFAGFKAELGQFDDKEEIIGNGIKIHKHETVSI